MAAGPSVLLSTEGSYPYVRGELSTWCESLTSKLSEVDFTVVAITPHPYLSPQCDLAPNVREVITVPLSGMEDAAEYGHHDGFLEFLRRRWSTSSREIQEDYLPHYRHVLQEIVSPSGLPRSLGIPLLRLHQHLRTSDVERTQTHPAVWDAFVEIVQPAWREASAGAAPPSLAELGEAFRLISRLTLPLALNAPRADLTHSVGAGISGLPGVIQKLRWGTPFLITDHGNYPRAAHRAPDTPSFVSWFLNRLTTTIADVSYAFADQVSPVCQYSARWAIGRQVDEPRIRVIYSGVDPATFSPAGALLRRASRPVVAAVGPIEPGKGQLDLIEAAALVRETIPEVEFRIYGSPADAAYVAECRSRVASHQLEGNVVFAGETDEPWSAYRESAVVAFPGTADDFPLGVVEAMMAGCAIVAVDVGGAREAIEETGLLVRPGDAAAIAEALVTLIQAPNARATLGERARDRALTFFTEQQFVSDYRASYARLVFPQPAVPDAGDVCDETQEIESLATSSVETV